MALLLSLIKLAVQKRYFFILIFQARYINFGTINDYKINSFFFQFSAIIS
jgi:hypothetical protein